jgi:hypothetical protein
MPSPCGEGGREALERGEISSPNVDAIKRRLSPRPEKVVPKEPIEVDTKNNKVFNL